MSNTFGKIFKISTFGESHGKAVGVVIDGCPANLEISEMDIQSELDRRKPGQSRITTERDESDTVEILSGVFEGRTTGTPITLIVFNKDQKSKDYSNMKDLYRPGHADFTYQTKYGIRDYRGGGRSSARETLARVAAGAIAQKYLQEKLGIEFVSFVEQVGNIKAQDNFNKITRKQVESSMVRCPNQLMSKKMIALIDQVKSEGDSIGGIIRGIIRNVPAGLGEPAFDKLPAELAKAMLSIGATKGFEFGQGFKAATMRGSEHNDEFYSKDKAIRTRTNNAGGTLGGISTGESIYFRVAFKPTATIQKEQNTVNLERDKVKLQASGRHDPCVVPRAVPIVDAMGALVIMDLYLRHKAIK